MDEPLCPACGVTPRPALEHHPTCPTRLHFYGAPWEWGVGNHHELRRDIGGHLWRYEHTWRPLVEETHMITLDDWHVIPSRGALTGIVNGHPTCTDGHRVTHTSTVRQVTQQGDAYHAITASGTVYVLLTPAEGQESIDMLLDMVND